MNRHILISAVAGSLLACTSVQASSETERLRALVIEQERQIQLLEQENAQLRADSIARNIPARTLQTSGSNLVSVPATAQSSAPSRPAQSGTYTVVPGDNLVRIGRQLGISARSLAKANGLETSSVIHPGQKLKVPAAVSAAPATAARTAAPRAAATHTVQPGETFYSIARQHRISVDRLMAANPNTQPAALRVGQKVQLPETTSTQASVSAATPNSNGASLPEIKTTSESPQPAAQSTGNRRQVRTMMIDGEMSYGAFAAKHGTTPERLNQLNGLDLDARTVLAKGSELYVPAQP